MNQLFDCVVRSVT